MDKILVYMEIPVINQKIEMYIPTFLQIRELTGLIATAIEEISEHQYISSGKEILCLKKTIVKLERNRTIASYDIKNGDHLVMI